MKRNILITIVVIVVVVAGFIVFSMQQPEKLISRTQSVLSADQTMGAFVATTKNSCQFHVQHGSDNTVVKTVDTNGDATACNFQTVRGFSPDNKFLFIDSGTSTTRKAEVIDTASGKIIASFAAYDPYFWVKPYDLLFVFPSSSTDANRPWEGGAGSSVGRLDLKTGKITELLKADATHDYFSSDSVEPALRDKTWLDKIVIAMQTYPAAGANRFLNPTTKTVSVDANGIVK